MGVYEIVRGCGMVENEIYLGNAYELIKQIEDNSVDLIVTDPPYEIEGIKGNGKLHGIFAKDRLDGFDQRGRMNLFDI